jgi:hypothetical protein
MKSTNGQARRCERGLMHVFRVTAGEDEMDRMAEKQDAARFVTTTSTMVISRAGATLGDFVLLSFLIVYWRSSPAGEDQPRMATGGGYQLCLP